MNYASLTNGNLNNTPASSPTQWQAVASGNLPKSSAVGIYSAGIPFNNFTTNLPQDITITVDLAEIDGVKKLLTTGPCTLAGFNYPEQSVITVATDNGDGTMTITMAVRNPNSAYVIFQGGIAGQYISFDANLAFSTMRSSYFAFGSLKRYRILFTDSKAFGTLFTRTPSNGRG